YSGKKIAGSHCTVVSTYTAADSRPRGPAPTPAPVATGGSGSGGQAAAPSAARVDFRTAAAGQTLAAAPGASGARVTRGAVYKYERNGVVHYTNVRPAGATAAQMLFSYIETCYACGVLPGLDFGTVRLNMDAYAAEVRAAAREFGVDEAV